MKRDYAKVFILRTIGNFLLLSAVACVVLTFLPVVQAEISYRYGRLMGKKYVLAEDYDPKRPKTGFGRILITPPLLITPADKEFGIVIPKIDANSKIVPEVDAGNADVYLEALKHGVAHVSGTAYPGQVGNSVLFAHSVGNFWEVNQWNAVFYLLRELNVNDEVDVFYKGKRYVYSVYEKTIVDPDQVDFLDPNADFAKLTLQTCWPPGTTLKRLLVFAKLRSL